MNRGAFKIEAYIEALCDLRDRPDLKQNDLGADYSTPGQSN